MLTTIQAGRALAALAVAAFHLSITMGVGRYGGVPVLREWTYGGHLGVDFFFVLSGFVIMMAHAKDIGQPQQVASYLWKRFIRVYPVYLLYSGAFVALVILGFGNATPIPQTPTGWLTALTLVRFNAEAPPITPAWTLFHEVAFYGFFGILIWHRSIGLFLMASWLLACAVLWNYPEESGRTALAVYLSAYSFHFVLGMLAYMAFRRLSGTSCTVLGAGCLGILAIAHITTSAAPLIAWAIGFAGVLMIATCVEQKTGLSVPGWLRYIGDASYTLYLLHIPLQGLFLKLAIKSTLADRIGGIGTYLVVLIATIIVACIIYKFAEAPLLQILRKESSARPARPMRGAI